MYRYKLISTNESSAHYGPCEVCGEHCSEVFHQIEEEKHSRGWTRHKCHSLFGHLECLKGTRREN